MIRGTSIDLGLELLETIREPGYACTYREIAAVCTAIDPEHPVSHQDIWFLEHRALAKIRRAFEAREKAATRKAVLA